VRRLALLAAVVVEVGVSLVESVDELAHAIAPASRTKRSGRRMALRRFRIHLQFHMLARNE
jgi:hypothetical protein